MPFSLSVVTELIARPAGPAASAIAHMRKPPPLGEAPRQPGRRRSLSRECRSADVLQLGLFWVPSQRPRSTIVSNMSSMHRTSRTLGNPMTPSDFDGKEGVAGSSPAEALIGTPLRRGFLSPRPFLPPLSERLLGPTGS